MRAVLVIAVELLREALRRKWILAFGIAITGFLLLTFGALRLDGVDAFLKSTRHQAPDVGTQAIALALRPVFEAVAYLIFYCGIVFGCIGCAEFAPRFMSPGRIEHLLSQPVRRSQIIVGTFLGVWVLASFAMLYAALGFSVILWIKTGVSVAGLVFAALLASFAWAAIYSVMLAVSTWVRSSTLAAAVGVFVLVSGIVAGHRAGVLRLFGPGLARGVFSFVSLLFPKVSSLAAVCAKVAGAESVQLVETLGLVAGFLVFTLVGLGVAMLSFERKDF